MQRALGRAFPAAEDIQYLDSLVALAFGEHVNLAKLPAVSAAFSSALAKEMHPERAVAEGNCRIAGLEYDFLGERSDIEDWTVGQILSVLRLRRTMPTKQAAVIGTMRDDGIYAIEWIAHYQSLGFDPLVIYSNDNADFSERLLRRLADRAEIIFVESRTSGRVRPEVKAFEHAYHFVPEVRACEWALYVDSDEFFVPAPRYNDRIENVIEDLKRQREPVTPSAVLYQWLWFVSGMVFERKPGLLMERFRYASPNSLTKPFVRLRDLMSMRLQHVPEMFPGAVIVDASYEPVDMEQVWTPREPTYARGRINHYWPKSFQEFSLKKARGDSLPLEDDEYRRDFSLFFEWNAPETREIFHPPDEAFLAKVKARCESLRAIDGVREAEAQVERRFSELLNRYHADGGLARIYQALRRTTSYGLTPTA